MVTDQIADYLTRIRNGIAARHRIVSVPSSKLKVAITEVLVDKGYIKKYKVVEDGPKKTLKIALKYDRISKKPAISGIHRVSKPGLRKYTKSDSLPRVLNGMGIAVISTSKGVISDKEARQMKVGGEVLCHVY